MQHDIYSLGICLLEIGLWKSFSSYNDSTTASLSAAVLSVSLNDPEFRQSNVMKEHLTALAKCDLSE